jgi:hypothetical protein
MKTTNQIINALCKNFTGRNITPTDEELKIFTEYQRIKALDVWGATEIEILVKYTMMMRGCTRYEADMWVSLELECGIGSHTLDEVKSEIAKSVGYDRLLKTGHDEELAYEIAHHGEFVLDYNTDLTESEKINAVYRNYKRLPAEYREYNQAA